MNSLVQLLNKGHIQDTLNISQRLKTQYVDNNNDDNNNTTIFNIYSF